MEDREVKVDKEIRFNLNDNVEEHEYKIKRNLGLFNEFVITPVDKSGNAISDSSLAAGFEYELTFLSYRVYNNLPKLINNLEGNVGVS